MEEQAGSRWAMTGEAIVGLFARPAAVGLIGPDLDPLPGPGAILAVRYQSSPIGPFTEVSILEPVRRGPRVGSP